MTVGTPFSTMTACHFSALIGQGLTVADAAMAGVYLHGLAGELAAKGSIGLAASELLQMLPEARKQVKE